MKRAAQLIISHSAQILRGEWMSGAGDICNKCFGDEYVASSKSRQSSQTFNAKIWAAAAWLEFGFWVRTSTNGHLAPMCKSISRI